MKMQNTVNANAAAPFVVSFPRSDLSPTADLLPAPALPDRFAPDRNQPLRATWRYPVVLAALGLAELIRRFPAAQAQSPADLPNQCHLDDNACWDTRPEPLLLADYLGGNLPTQVPNNCPPGCYTTPEQITDQAQTAGVLGIIIGSLPATKIARLAVALYGQLAQYQIRHSYQALKANCEAKGCYQ